MGARVETTHGRLVGREEDGVLVFRGIPYATPPVGDARFRPAKPARPWPGERDAGEFGASAPQNPMLIPLPGMDVGRTDEDCLTLNVWTPGTADGRRPVMVWIHGGGFVLGSGSQPVYDGAALARRGDVVVVTINYRLGPLGFLFLDELVPELGGDTANLGLRDQIAALRFVRENAAAFGGDPANVTIFGESAGGMSVATLLAMPEARGLFRRAIAQSGAGHNAHTRETATATAEAYLAHLGVERGEAARALRELPAAKLLDAQQQTVMKLGTKLVLLPFQPVVDGRSLPARAVDAVRAGSAAGVSLLAGTTRDEWRLFSVLDPSLRELDAAGLSKRLAESRVPDAQALIDIYRKSREGRLPVDPLSLLAAIETDRIFRLPAIRLAEAQGAHAGEVFLYRFDWESPSLGGMLGACHAVELPFVFGTYGKPGGDFFVGTGEPVAALSELASDAWLAFARSGRPGHPGLPDWPAYETARRATLVFGPTCRLEEDPEGDERRAWEGSI